MAGEIPCTGAMFRTVMNDMPVVSILALFLVFALAAVDLKKPYWVLGAVGTLLAGMIWLIDVKKMNGWTKPFVIFGANAIFLYAASGIWTKIMLRIQFEFDGKIISGYGYLYKTIFQPMAGDINGSLLFALFHVFMFWLILAWMYKKKIFLKI